MGPFRRRVAQTRRAWMTQTKRQSHSDERTYMELSRCMRCFGTIDHTQSFFCVVLSRKRSKLSTEIRKASEVTFGMTVMHVNGDRQCGKTVAAYHKHILEALNIDVDLDISFVDTL